MTEEASTTNQGPISEEAKEHFSSAKREFKKGLDAIFPPSVKEHRQAAQKEVLLGLKSLIDAALEKIDEAEEE